MPIKLLIGLLAVSLLIPFLTSCDAEIGLPVLTDRFSQTDPPGQNTSTEEVTTPETVGDPKPSLQNFTFDGSVTKDVLCSYLNRAVTISLEDHYTAKPTDTHIKAFLLNTGAKYVCRFATCWAPSASDIETHAEQKEFLEMVHAIDSEIVFEACIFECVSTAVNQIPIPAYVFEAFDLSTELRNFRFDDMCFQDGKYLNHWGENTAVPDMTQLETQMFFYYRARSYIDLGYEALHLGQVHLIGENDNGWECWTRTLDLIRAYAKENARRHFVFLNAHTHGIIDANDKLMFDFHMYPSRPMAIGSTAHAPSEDDPQKCLFSANHADSIYRRSMGGETYSGWTCDSLPYLVELDNFGCDTSILDIPDSNDIRCWGMDEISWFANQPAAYRQQFLKYAYQWVKNTAPGDGFFAMPGQRVAFLFNEDREAYAWQYYAYDPANHEKGNGDELFIKQIWENDG